jgi:putative addiction module component (TIGR02574 family)
MKSSVDRLTEEALALPAEARALLAEQLAASLDSPKDEEFHALWAAEAIRRRDEVKAGKVKPISAGKALAQLRKSLGE